MPSQRTTEIVLMAALVAAPAVLFVTGEFLVCYYMLTVDDTWCEAILSMFPL